MSEKICLARAEIVDLLSLILRTHSRDELFSLFRSAEGIMPKEDPEAWREECRKKQAAGVRFEVISDGGNWHKGNSWKFDGNKEYYREVPQPAISPESPEMRDHRISEAIANLARNYCADKGTAPLAKASPHAAERALWKAQREAGTNEVWQIDRSLIPRWIDISADKEPTWSPGCRYRVKPMKLTARIALKIGNSGAYAKAQDSEFTGTREEYRAECEKYGYVVISEIKEVKPETVKYYMAMLTDMPSGFPFTMCHKDKEVIIKNASQAGLHIIGDIEEREIEA